MKLHPNEISNPNNFKKGSIAPDLNSNFSKILSKPEKVTTHYYLNPSANITDFNAFTHDKKVDLKNDYWKGYYLHLLADHAFYTHFFKQEFDQSAKDNVGLYDDFDMLTSRIIKDYHLKLNDDYITDTIKQYFVIKNGRCKYLSYAKAHDFIEKISTNPNQIIQNIL